MLQLRGGTMTDSIRRSFDAAAETHAREFADELDRKPFDRELLAGFASKRRPGAGVLDVGTGAGGHIGRFLADRGLVVTGIDVSPGAIEVARRLNPTMSFVVADFRSLPVPEASVDAVVSFYCYIYGTDEDIIQALGEARRVLRPGGRLLAAITVLSTTGPGSRRSRTSTAYRSISRCGTRRPPPSRRLSSVPVCASWSCRRATHTSSSIRVGDSISWLSCLHRQSLDRAGDHDLACAKADRQEQTPAIVIGVPFAYTSGPVAELVLVRVGARTVVTRSAKNPMMTTPGRFAVDVSTGD